MFLCFPSLNHLHTHNERTHVFCPSTLMWCSLHVTRDDREDNVCALHANFLCNWIQIREFLKIFTQNTRMLPTRVLKV